MEANATDLVMEDDLKFSWFDYTLFTGMLISSAVIGIYFGCSGNKQSSAKEYLLGGKEMGVFPISMSLIASFISGITILAVPADVYRFGATYAIGGVAIFFVIITTTFVFVPVFFNLQISSTFEYINLRFGEKVRKLCSLLYAISMVLYLPIVIYVPALALSQGTGLNIHLITPIVCGVCVFYTTIGGLKAVVWTDTLQFIIMIGSTIIVTYLGTTKTGGFMEVMKISAKGERLDLDTDLDLTKRDTLWTSLFGLYFSWMTIIGIGQGCIQKCMALPTMKDVKKTMAIFAIGMLVLIVSSVYSGLMIYAKYSKCDPLQNNKIRAYDQILPLFALDVASSIPGLPGLFIAGVFSAALSTLSASLNSMSCTIYQDFIAGLMPKNTSQKKVSTILKILVFVIGIVSTVLVFVVEKMGGALELGFSLGGITQGPILGLFVLGMLVPFANSKGALSGAIVSLIFMIWIVMGSTYYKMNGYFTHESKPLSTEGCPNIFNNTAEARIQNTMDEPFYIFRISHYFYGIIGGLLVLAVGLPVSWYSENDENTKVSKDLISPVMHWSLPNLNLKEKNPLAYLSVEKANKELSINNGN